MFDKNSRKRFEEIHTEGKITGNRTMNEQVTIAGEVQGDPELGQMIEDSRQAHRQGQVVTTAELLKSITNNDFQCPVDM